MKTTFLPCGRKPTIEDVLKAAQANPILHAATQLGSQGFSTEEWLMLSVLLLVEQNSTLIDKLTDIALHSPTVYHDLGSR